MRILWTIPLGLFFLISSCSSPDQKTTKPESPGKEESVSEKGPETEPGPAVELPSVTIGEQTWTSTNLDVGVFRNGDSIPYVADEAAWEKASRDKTPAWCYFENDPVTGEKWGALYNFHAVADPRGLAPSGWHVPTKEEYEALEIALGGSSVAATPLKDLSLWDEPNTGEASGFNAPPSHGRFDDGPFIDFDMDIGYWWSCTPRKNSRSSYYIAMSVADPISTISSLESGYGFSVRLVKD